MPEDSKHSTDKEETEMLMEQKTEGGGHQRSRRKKRKKKDKRFNEAQKAEKHHWTSKLVKYETMIAKKKMNVYAYVRNRFADTLTRRQHKKEYFKDKSVLEVGSGPYPMVLWLGNAKRRVVVEPLWGWFNSRRKKDLNMGDIEVHSVQIEKTELEKEQFDICILKNVLDHTSTPKKMINKCSGAKEIWVDVYIGKPKYMLKPHPSKFETLDEVLDLFEESGYQLIFHLVRGYYHYFTWIKRGV